MMMGTAHVSQFIIRGGRHRLCICGQASNSSRPGQNSASICYNGYSWQSLKLEQQSVSQPMSLASAVAMARGGGTQDGPEHSACAVRPHHDRGLQSNRRKKGVYSSSMQRELQAWQYRVVQHLFMHMHEMPCICNELMATWAASGMLQGGQWRRKLCWEAGCGDAACRWIQAMAWQGLPAAVLTPGLQACKQQTFSASSMHVLLIRLIAHLKHGR